MKYGLCLSVGEALRFEDYGSDYYEFFAARVAQLPEEHYRELQEAVRSGRIRSYSGNGLFDPDDKRLRLTGPDVDPAYLDEFILRVFDRMAGIGAKLLVFGSGKAKNIPEGFPREEAWKQLIALGHRLADEADKYGMTVVVEPLSFDEVNVINTVDEGANYVREVNRKSFRLMADFYHVSHNEEPMEEEIRRNRDILAHFHYAAKGTRNLLQTEEQWDYLRRAFNVLREIGYEGGISYEGGHEDTPEGIAAVKAMIDKVRTL